MYWKAGHDIDKPIFDMVCADIFSSQYLIIQNDVFVLVFVTSLHPDGCMIFFKFETNVGCFHFWNLHHHKSLWEKQNRPD